MQSSPEALLMPILKIGLCQSWLPGLAAAFCRDPCTMLQEEQHSCPYNLLTLALQVLGCLKGILAVVVSLMVFGNQMSRLGAVGYGITVMGVLGYGLSKHRSLLSRYLRVP